RAVSTDPLGRWRFSLLLPDVTPRYGKGRGLLFAGDDWAEGHHDVVVRDDAGKTLARRRLPEGAVGLARVHELVRSCWGEDSEPDPARVVVVIETDRGAWVKAGRGRVPGVPGEPEAGGPAQGDDRELGEEGRLLRRRVPGGHGPHPAAP